MIVFCIDQWPGFVAARKSKMVAGHPTTARTPTRRSASQPTGVPRRSNFRLNISGRRPRRD